MKTGLRNRFTILLLSFLIFGTAVGPMPASAEITGTDPENVITGIIDALNSGDVDSALALVADQAVVVLMPPPLTGPTYAGKEEIGAWWETFVSNQGSITVANMQSTGTMATWSATITENAFTALGLESLTFEGVGIVHSGLLQSYTWIMSEESLARLQEAIGMATNQALAQRYMEEIWNQGDLAIIDELVAENFVSHNFPAGDREALKASVIDFRTETPNAYFTYDDITVTEDRIFLVTTLMIRPEDAPADAEGEPASEPMVLILGVGRGKITDHWLFMHAPAEISVPIE